MSKHTPGPWHFHELQDGADGLGYIRCQVDDLEICHCGDIGRRREENLANAYLKAAAPDMLAALKSVRQELWVDHCMHMGRTDCDQRYFNSRPRIRIIDAAIAKAEGGAA